MGMRVFLSLNLCPELSPWVLKEKGGTVLPAAPENKEMTIFL